MDKSMSSLFKDSQMKDQSLPKPKRSSITEFKQIFSTTGTSHHFRAGASEPSTPFVDQVANSVTKMGPAVTEDEAKMRRFVPIAPIRRGKKRNKRGLKQDDYYVDDSEKGELQDMYVSIRQVTPIFEELCEKPEPSNSCLGQMGQENLIKFGQIVERSLEDEFNVFTTKTDFTQFNKTNPSILQAAHLLQGPNNFLPYKAEELESEENEREITQLSYESISGDYSRYTDVRSLLQDCPSIDPETDKAMFVTASLVSQNFKMHPRIRKRVVDIVYSVAKEAHKRPTASK
ncbi:hypothetical protein ROZALSC1DRAFT_31727 [Rozella allomycis CSF55]|uniref:Uncharacterized protein n=1 Tax=Rozella allomycis (strain CSF55) TaxID=988480 RepID=A0A4P9YBQ1_ROZAC|nr:hypothetical protein ROZALSC1DRAFT_31727 [Rozella allomycis CSF55]